MQLAMWTIGLKYADYEWVSVGYDINVTQLFI